MRPVPIPEDGTEDELKAVLLREVTAVFCRSCGEQFVSTGRIVCPQCSTAAAAWEEKVRQSLRQAGPMLLDAHLLDLRVVVDLTRPDLLPKIQL